MHQNTFRKSFRNIFKWSEEESLKNNEQRRDQSIRDSEDTTRRQIRNMQRCCLFEAAGKEEHHQIRR